MALVLAYIPCPTEDEAKRIALHLLEQKLIACANIFPVSTLYRSEGEIAEEGEFVPLAKTTAEKFDAMRHEVEETHPYETPCILRIDAQANDAYHKWASQRCG